MSLGSKVDLQLVSAYKKYRAEDFRQGFRLLLANFKDLRTALAIKDLDRTPRNPAALLSLIRHLHANKSLPAGVLINVQVDTETIVTRSLVVLTVVGKLQVTVEFWSGKGPTLFSYRTYKRLPPVVVQAEGLLVIETYDEN